jgi:hypothetical protein
MCAASAARAQRVTATTSSHVNGCSPVCRLSARASWRPQYPLLPQCTWRSPLATENGRVCRVVDRGRQYHQPRPRFKASNQLSTEIQHRTNKRNTQICAGAGGGALAKVRQAESGCRAVPRKRGLSAAHSRAVTPVAVTPAARVGAVRPGPGSSPLAGSLRLCADVHGRADYFKRNTTQNKQTKYTDMRGGRRRGGRVGRCE